MTYLEVVKEKEKLEEKIQKEKEKNELLGQKLKELGYDIDEILNQNK